MLRERIVKILADEAIEADTYSVYSSESVFQHVRQRMKNLGADKRDKAAYAMDNERLSRRDFLQVLGIGTAAGTLGVMGAAKLFSVMEHETIAGYAASDSEDYEIITVTGGETRTIGAGETFSNKLIDQSASGASYTLQCKGDEWEVLNVGWHGTGQGQYKSPTAQHLQGIEGHGVIDTIYARGYNGTEMGGMRAAVGHSDVIEVRHSNISGMSNNAAYCSGPAIGRKTSSGTPGGGRINFFRCFHHDNTVSNYRIANNSVVKESVAICPHQNADPARPTYPTNSGDMCRAFIAAENNITVEDSDIWIADSGHVMLAKNGVGVSAGTGGSLTFRNCRVRPGKAKGWQNKPYVDASGITELSEMPKAPEGVPKNAEEAASGDAEGGFAISASGAASNSGTEEPC